MPRSVQDVDAITVVAELQNRAGHRDAALLFDLHPIRHSGARALFAFHDARLLDGAAVQKQLFRQRRLARVRVRNDRERAALIDLFDKVFHKNPPNPISMLKIQFIV